MFEHHRIRETLAGTAGLLMPHATMMYLHSNGIGYYNTRKAFSFASYGTFHAPKHWPCLEQLNRGLERLKDAGIVDRLLTYSVRVVESIHGQGAIKFFFLPPTELLLVSTPPFLSKIANKKMQQTLEILSLCPQPNSGNTDLPRCPHVTANVGLEKGPIFLSFCKVSPKGLPQGERSSEQQQQQPNALDPRVILSPLLILGMGCAIALLAFVAEAGKQRRRRRRSGRPPKDAQNVIHVRPRQLSSLHN